MGNLGSFFENGFGIFRIVPEAVLGNGGFDFSQSFFQAVQVKDSSAGVLILF